jgi:hypothetical protein
MTGRDPDELHRGDTAQAAVGPRVPVREVAPLVDDELDPRASGPTRAHELRGPIGTASVNPTAPATAQREHLWDVSEDLTGVRYMLFRRP